MVAGLKFLSKKGFNPQNLSNQKRVWEREEQKKTEERRIKEREDQLRRERDDEELARARGDSLKVSFLYKPPPGLEVSKDSNNKSASAPSSSSISSSKPGATAASSSNEMTFRQPGDDDAAAAFRAMFAASTSATTAASTEEDDVVVNEHDSRGILRGTAPGAFGTVLQGSSYDKNGVKKEDKQSFDPSSLSTLEKAVGRRQQGSALTLDEQIERFPALANAPRQRGVQVGVNFKPLGTQIRNVRCMKCGIWGHSKGDRECHLSGWDPFSGSIPTNPNDSNLSKLATTAEQESTKRDAKEERRRERRKRKRRSRRDDSDSDSDSSSSDSSESDYEERKRKSKRKHHRSRSSRHYDDSDDDCNAKKKKKKKHHRKEKRR